jgi:hypothetical protein
MKLSEGIELYVKHRQAEGLLFITGEKIFRSFSKSLGDVQLSQVGSGDVQKFSDERPTAPKTRCNKYQLLAALFAFWSCRKAVAEFVMPPPRLQVNQRVTPHIYTRAELSALLSSPWCKC